MVHPADGADGAPCGAGNAGLSGYAEPDLKLPHINTPALAMVGELSEGDIPDRAQGQADRMPNCTLARIPGAGGYVQHSAPAQCVEAWLEFVGAQHARGG